jgi:hypothetical protein
MMLPLLPLVLDQAPPGLRLALAQEGLPVVDREERPLAGRFVIGDSRRGLQTPLASSQTLLDLHSLRSGFPSDPFEALLDEQAARCQWRIGSVAVSEDVARIDKRALRRRLMAGLRRMLESAGGVWIKLAAWPFPYRSAFNFRLDHDEFDETDFDAVLAAIGGHEGSISHYVCGSTHELERAALMRLRGADVGSHGYWHHTYYDAQDNLKNIRRGIDVLEAAGLAPSGYVAPHGRFNRGLAWAMQSLGIGHSSEFGLAYDDLPFFPPGSEVLQIPVHPICLGLFLEATRLDASPRRTSVPNDAANDAIIDGAAAHLADAIGEKYYAGEPVFLYGHPDGRLGRYPRVLGKTLEAAAAYSGLWRTDRTTIARWWRQRAATTFSVSREEDCFVVQASERADSWTSAIEFWRGEHVALLPITSPELRFSPESVAYERRRPARLPNAVRIDGAHSIRSRVRRYLDWEKATPVEEINSSTLRGWLKKTLRKVRR